MNGKVYKITNKINNKIYIGITTNTLEDRWKQHVNTAYGISKDSKSIFKKAIRKYGKENFTKEILEENIDSLRLIKILIDISVFGKNKY